MSRAFTPPDTLSKDDIKTIADVRRAIWTQALKGLCYGTVAGYSAHTLLKLGHKKGVWKLANNNLNKNTALLSVLLGGAMGSFVMAITTGKNQVHNLHPIFEIGAADDDDDEGRRGRGSAPKLMQYHQEQAKLRDMDLKQLEKRAKQHQHDLGYYMTEDEHQLADRIRREKNRLYRRASLSQSLQHGGLSDSHGGHWIKDDDDDDDDDEFNNISTGGIDDPFAGTTTGGGGGGGRQQ